MEYDFDRVYDRRGTDSSKWGRVDPDVLPMPVADMDFPSPEPIRRALRERVEQGFYGYGLATQDFHEAFTSRLKRRYEWDVAHEALVPIPGVIPGFNMGLRALTSPGDGVLVQMPAYPPILNANGHHGLVRQDAFLVRGDSGRYEIDWPSLEAAIDETTRVFLLCNPHNPVGRAHSADELRAVAELAAMYGATIVSDEIHGPLTYPDAVFTPFLSVSDAAREVGVCVTAASKAWNLAGLKCAVMVTADGPNQQVVGSMPDEVYWRTSILGLKASIAGYREGTEWLDGIISSLDANRRLLTALLAEQLPAVKYRMPEATYLAWLDFRALDWGDDPAEHALEHAKVALSNGPPFGAPGRGFARLNLACAPETLTEAVARLADLR